MAYIGNSIVDYLKSVGQDSSYSARAALAAKNGISNYVGDADQNTKLLNILNKPATSTPASTPKSTAYDTTSKYIQDPFNAGASIPNPNYVAPITPVASTVTNPIVNPTITPAVVDNTLLQSVKDEQQKRIDHPELYDANGKLKTTELVPPAVKDISLNVPTVNLTVPVLTTPTAGETSSALITSLSTQLTQANTALEASYKVQLDKIASDKLATQAKIDAITAKEETTLGDVKNLTAPFREELENAERERLYINENFEANQTLTNELDGLLTEGNTLISQLKGTTGLTSIRNPRVNEAIDAVNARAGVISAVMSARNSQINQAYTMIDRTTAAITSDKNDQLSYYNALLSFYDSSKTTEGNKLITLNADEKVYINAKIANLESDVASIKKTSDAVKEALINPATALLYAKAGVTLNDSISEINAKLAKQTYATEVINTANTMATNGYTQTSAGATVPSGYESMTTYDSQGIASTWLRKKTKAEDTNIGKTVTVDKKVYQYNPTTGMYDIPVGPTGPTAEDTLGIKVKVDAINAQITDINDIMSDTNGMNEALSTTWFGDIQRAWGNLSGSVQGFIGSVENIVSTGTLTALINAKANGATFGALSDAELALLGSSFSRIRQWQVREGGKPEGKVIGYNIDRPTFEKELKDIQAHANLLKGYLVESQKANESTPTDPNDPFGW